MQTISFVIANNLYLAHINRENGQESTFFM